MKLSPLLLSSLLAGAVAIPLNDVVHEKRHPLGPKWQKRDTLDANSAIPVRIALKQTNLEKGMDYLLEVADPASPKYGKHYTPDEVIGLFAPHDETINAVKSWLINNGVASNSIHLSKSKGWLDFTTTVSHLESVLQAKYHFYSHADGKGQQITSDTYVVPGEVAEHIDFITPAMAVSTKVESPTRVEKSIAAGSKVPNPTKPKPLPAQVVQKLQANLESTQYCSNYVTPQCIKAFYNITRGKHSASSNRLGIFESDDEYPSQEDLTAFFGLFYPDIPSTVGPKIDLIDFGSTPPDSANAVGEAALDFDMAYPIIYPQGTELFQSKDNFNPYNGTVGFFNQFLDAIDGAYCVTKSHNETGDDPVVDGPTPNEQCGTFKPTNVISFSYGWSESEFPAGYLERQCDEFMKLGLQGTTLVFSSGDGGVAGGHGSDCLGKNGDIFNPQIGASCPYVTVVGSTVLPAGSSADGAQKATDSFASGGGFSNIWVTPVWQQSAVASYFSNYDPGFPSYSTSGNKIPRGKGVFNRAGRAYPDLAAIGDNGVTVFQGSVGLSGGTSMSAPIVASIFTRINDELIAKGKPTIGFANPALYSNPGMFNDITLGDQSSNGYCKGRGFKAVPGWDPVTGLGSPIYPEFLKYFLSLS